MPEVLRRLGDAELVECSSTDDGEDRGGAGAPFCDETDFGVMGQRMDVGWEISDVRRISVASICCISYVVLSEA